MIPVFLLPHRVYDNAQANAVMQKAITILSIEEGLSKKRRERFRHHIHEKCCPLVSDYDDDEVSPGGEDLQKVTIQIKVRLGSCRKFVVKQILSPYKSK